MTSAEHALGGTMAPGREQYAYANSSVGSTSETQRNIIRERLLGLAREPR